jgi:hypothetical protein
MILFLHKCLNKILVEAGTIGSTYRPPYLRCANMQDSFSNNEEYRQLRAVTVLAFIPGFSLLLPAGVSSSHALPATGIAPLAFSACQGVLILTGRLQLASKKALIDLLLALFFFAILVPRCVVILYPTTTFDRQTDRLVFLCLSWVEIEHYGNYRWVGSGVTMLSSYGTAIMMLDLYGTLLFPDPAIYVH